MQTLIFNTKDKTAGLYSDSTCTIIITNFTFSDVSTITPRSDGYYEIMKMVSINKTIPVARLPIHNTNMLIKNE
jgi:hypothetical protein